MLRGLTPVWSCMGTRPNEPVQLLLFSTSMIAHCRLTKKLSTYVFQVPDPRFGVRLFLLLTGYQPQSSATAISPGIARGFARNAELYDDNIDLATDGGKVTLSGTVATQSVSLVREVVALVLAVANCSKPHCLIKVTSTSRCWPTRSLASSTSARDHASACTAPSSQQEETAVLVASSSSPWHQTFS